MYTPREAGLKFTQDEREYLDNLWDTGELRGVGKYYAEVTERAAAHLARTPKYFPLSLCRKSTKRTRGIGNTVL